MCNLGSCHLYDTAGIERDPAQAVAWFEQARAHARAGGRARACSGAEGYSFALSVQAASMGCTSAQYMLGLCFDHGCGTEHNLRDAVRH